MISIKVESRRVSYEVTLNRKMTIIRGMSGEGKSILVNGLSNRINGYKRHISDSRYKLFLLDGDDWYNSMEYRIKDRDKNFIIVIDDKECVSTEEFCHLFNQDTHNFYILVDRLAQLTEFDSMAGLQVAVDSVYELKTSGRDHWVVPSYVGGEPSYRGLEFVATEDTKSGLLFLRRFNPDVSTTQGKTKVLSFIDRNKAKLKGSHMLLFVDLSNFGLLIEKLAVKAKELNLDVSIISHYLSFECMLLESNFFNYDVDKIPNDVIAAYPSHEILLEHEIARLSEGYPYSYNAVRDKSRLSTCYYENCCVMHKDCNKGIKGNKLEELFRGTPYEDWMTLVRNSHLVKLT